RPSPDLAAASVPPKSSSPDIPTWTIPVGRSDPSVAGTPTHGGSPHGPFGPITTGSETATTPGAIPPVIATSPDGAHAAQPSSSTSGREPPAPRAAPSPRASRLDGRVRPGRAGVPAAGHGHDRLRVHLQRLQLSAPGRA